jgi:peptidoglycan/LPS O-acetylase OafA/YrhL
LILDNHGRIRELDGWRAVSVALVIVHHLFTYRFPRILEGMPALLTWSADIGPLGVRIFFVISGFVICRLIIAEELRYGSVSLTGFYYRRLFRILPPLYLFLLSLFLMGVARWITVDNKALVMGALFLTNTKFAPNNWFSGHTWSLAVEEQFYLAFPTLWIVLSRWKRWRGPSFGLLFLLLAARDMESVYRGWHAHVATNSRNGFSCICAGVLMAIWEAKARKLVMGVPGWVVLVLGMTILVDPLRDAVLVNGLFHSLAEPLTIGLVLLYSTQRGAWLRAFLCCRATQAVGITSYGIYLWQELFTGPVENYHKAGAALAYLLPLLCVVVPVSYLFVEKPAMQVGKMLSRRTRQRMLDRAADKAHSPKGADPTNPSEVLKVPG